MYVSDNREYLSGGMIRSIGLVGAGAVLWSLGAILLFCRTTAGRVLVIIDSGLGLFYVLASVIRTEDPILLTMATPVLPILVLAALPSTGRWIAAEPRREGPVAPGGTAPDDSSMGS
ncbi:hypothetical protein [Nocardia pneumoniae]|uniref:hypothetical protein n=1 Tax=Nocardia pneumoniae TaxID=228601 RepID=UPI0002EFEE7F|nr:hypothetical protein [Nocardia pneumoniae]